MKLYFSPPSPFARKVLVAAAELGVRDKIDTVQVTLSPVQRNAAVAVHNPLGKIPCLELDDGTALFDSRVICAWINRQLGGSALVPAEDPARARVETLEALGDGLLDAAVLSRYEGFLRPEDKRWDPWLEGQMEKIGAALDALEEGWMDDLTGGMTLGVIAVGCALGYLDFRFSQLDWRAGHPRLAAWFGEFSKRPSMVDTDPVG